MITKERLLFDLYKAYAEARKHKAGKSYVKEFERNLHDNLLSLADAIYNKRYKAEPSMCFIITDPKKREVFAASFVDRIVHHLYYSYTHETFEKCFIYDSYSCIKGRGTHFGMDRLEHHIKSESHNYTRPCYVLKIDICGYFMHIDRNILYNTAKEILERKYTDEETKSIVMYLTKEIIMLDPMANCKVIGSADEWNGLPKSKSLRYSEKDCGLPIGNLTSQLFSNVYLNRFDHYCKRELRFKHYGRYVDDAYVVSCNKYRLRNAIPKVSGFLREELHLSLHLGKTQIFDANKGVEFLGAFLKPHRRYISNQCLRRMRNKIERGKTKYRAHIISAMLSRFGILSHYSAYNIRKQLICDMI